MRLTAPTKMVFYVSLVLALLGLVAAFVDIPFVTDYKFWFEFAAFVLLGAGVYFKGF
jgi:hypothetical protein